jgi:hypothetical protein
LGWKLGVPVGAGCRVLEYGDDRWRVVFERGTQAFFFD